MIENIGYATVTVILIIVAIDFYICGKRKYGENCKSFYRDLLREIKRKNVRR